MSTPSPAPIFRDSWDTPALLAAFPAGFTHANKRVVGAIAYPDGPEGAGRVAVSRWRAHGLPATVDGDVVVQAREGYFTYEADAPGTIAWHQNFADAHVFGFYAGGLFAQDEAQVSEHPALASVRLALVAAGHAWSEQYAQPTPVLVVGVERRVVVDTEPSLDAGRLQGLYGNRFAAATPDVVRSATRRIHPPTRSNILAIAAPPPHRGAYTTEQIGRILLTAYTGYAAAVIESASVAPDAKVVIHTGFWGCGAFGGNRALMVALQILAARMAGVAELVLHVGERSGLRDIEDARSVLARVPATGSVGVVIEALAGLGLQWGSSDGN